MIYGKQYSALGITLCFRTKSVFLKQFWGTNYAHDAPVLLP